MASASSCPAWTCAITSSSLRRASRAIVKPHGSELGCALLFMDELRSLQKALKGQPGRGYSSGRMKNVTQFPRQNPFTGEDLFCPPIGTKECCLRHSF